MMKAASAAPAAPATVLVEAKSRRATPLNTSAATAAMVGACGLLSASSTGYYTGRFPMTAGGQQTAAAAAPTRHRQPAISACLFTSCWTVPQQDSSSPSAAGGKRLANVSYRSSRSGSSESASRHTRNDWVNYNKASQRQFSREASAAEQARTEAWDTVRVTDWRTKSNQSEATRMLGERVRNIDYWRVQLEEEAQWSRAETKNLAEHLRVLEGALEDTSKPLNISEECLLMREKRTNIDLVCDEVERQLTREIVCIRRCQRQMEKVTERARQQLRQNEAALQELEKDLINKYQARCIDGRVSRLENQSPSIDYHPGVEKLNNSVSIPDSWVRFSQENIRQSRRSRTASERLRAAIGDVIRSCTNEMYSQFNAVNAAFAVRIREITDARSGLQSQLQRTVNEILGAETARVALRQAIADKQAPRQVAETRLAERARRVDMELCSDQPMNALQREVTDIHDSIRGLADRERAVAAALARLNASRLRLEAEIRVKENSLRIDAKGCLPMRKLFPIGSPTVSSS